MEQKNSATLPVEDSTILHRLWQLARLANDIVTANGWESQDIPKHIKARRDRYMDLWNSFPEDPTLLSVQVRTDTDRYIPPVELLTRLQQAYKESDFALSFYQEELSEMYSGNLDWDKPMSYHRKVLTMDQFSKLADLAAKQTQDWLAMMKEQLELQQVYGAEFLESIQNRWPAINDKEIDDRIEVWHTGIWPHYIPMQEVLSWGWSEYSKWVETCKLPPRIELTGVLLDNLYFKNCRETGQPSNAEGLKKFIHENRGRLAVLEYRKLKLLDEINFPTGNLPKPIVGIFRGPERGQVQELPRDSKPESDQE